MVKLPEGNVQKVEFVCMINTTVKMADQLYMQKHCFNSSSMSRYTQMFGSIKYPYLPHGRDWKFQRGGGSRVRKIPEGRGGGVVSIIYLFFSRPTGMFNFRLFAFCSRVVDAKINLAQHKINIFIVVRLDFCRRSSPVIFLNSGWYAKPMLWKKDE